ncbi:MAG: DMT family transporter [Gemmatimonadaceae bacterium]|nr:DMT family transporter [Gemmatimonadaceae bacterium]
MTDSDRSASRSATLAATVACICFGASVVVTRFVVPQTTPVILAFLRYVIATTCVLGMLGRRAFPAMPGADRAQLALLGALFFGVFPWSFSASLTHLPAATVALIVATNPLVTLALSAARGTERLTARIVIGQLLALGGIALALPWHTTAAVAGDGPRWIGYAEVGTTVLCGAIYNVWSRPLLLKYSSAVITGQSMLAGTIALAPLALWQGLGAHTRTITPSGWAAVLFLGTLGGAVGFGLWGLALRRSTPSRVAVFLALNPITAIALGVVLLGEPVTLTLAGALVLVITGIQLATRR